MVGGIVVEVIGLNDGKIWVNCQDEREEQCAIFVEQNADSIKIKPLDSLWWQSGYAYWTPVENKKLLDKKCSVDFDIKIPRIGFSGVNRPGTDWQIGLLNEADPIQYCAMEAICAHKCLDECKDYLFGVGLKGTLSK